MPQISKHEFEELPLRVHSLLAGVPLIDAWVVDLPRNRSGVTLDTFLQAAKARRRTMSPAAQALVAIRLLLGRVLGWDREPANFAWDTFAARLTANDQSTSLVPAGTCDGSNILGNQYTNTSKEFPSGKMDLVKTPMRTERSKLNKKALNPG